MALTPQQQAEYSANIKQQYNDILGRTPSQSEVDWYLNSGKDYATIEREFKNSPEYLNRQNPPTGGTGTTPPPTGGGIATPPPVDMSGVNNAISGVNNNITAGVGNINSNIATGVNNINGNITNAANNVNQNTNAGLNSLGQGIAGQFTSTNQNMQTGFNGMNTNMQTGFANNQTKMGEGFTGVTSGISGLQGDLSGLAGQLTDAQQAILGAQGTAQTSLNQIGTKQDTYYGDLAQKSTGIAGQVSGLQGDFTDHTTQYGKDQTRQTQANARIEGGIAGGFTQMGDQISQQNRQAQTSSLTSAVGGGQLNQLQPQGFTMADTARSIFSGAPSTQGDIQSRQVFINKLTQARQMAAQNPQLQDFVNAFDANGKLLADGQDANGRIARAIDGQGNLVVARLDQMGQVVAQNAYNLDQTLGQLGQQ